MLSTQQYSKVTYTKTYNITSSIENALAKIDNILASKLEELINGEEVEDIIILYNEVITGLVTGNSLQREILLAWLWNQPCFMDSKIAPIINSIPFIVTPIVHVGHTHSTTDIFHNSKSLHTEIETIKARITLVEDNVVGGGSQEPIYMIKGGSSDNSEFHPSVQ